MISSHRRVLTFLAGGVAAAVVATGAGPVIPAAGSVPPEGLAPAAVTTASATVTVNPGAAPVGALPTGFIGFSFESSQINNGMFAAAGNLPALLRNLGTGTLRFGGNSVDEKSFAGVTPAAVTGLGGLFRQTGWKVVYSVRLRPLSTTGVRADAARIAKLGAGLAAIACGNEPDNFGSGYTEAFYLETALPACIAAVRGGAPGVRISGPNTFRNACTSTCQPIWLPPYASAVRAAKAASPHGTLAAVSTLADQHYAVTVCGGKRPTAPDLLSRSTASVDSGVLAATRASAVTAGTPYVMAETNAVSCGGLKGLSNTYATALWAADWLLMGAEHGAAAMYVNGSLASTCASYAPLCEASPDSHALRAQPIYYGLLFAHLMGTGPALPSAVTSQANIAAHAVRSAGRIRLMVENLGAVPAVVTLRVPGASGAAATYSLTGPGLAATSGVRIQGATVSAAGTFTPGTPGTVACRAGQCRLTVPAYSGVIAVLPAIP
jgi:hypothetical protein